MRIQGEMETQEYSPAIAVSSSSDSLTNLKRPLKLIIMSRNQKGAEQKQNGWS